MRLLSRRAGAPPERVAGSGLIELPERRLFRHDALQQQFDESGFAVVQLLDSEAVSAMIAGFEQLGPLDHDDAYHHDLWGTDRGRKDRSRDFLAGFVDPAVERVLADYRLVTHAFIRKAQGESTIVAPHVDISFVDESRWRSVMAWISLTGASQGEGILHIVPGSHRLRDSMRAHMDDACTFAELVDDIVERWAVGIELEPGWAVFFDHGIARYAEPNLSGRTTLTAQSVCIPVEAQLRYPMADGPGRARIYEVDDDFYLGFSLNETPDDNLLARYPMAAEAVVPTERLNREQFEQLLARPRR